MPGFFVLMELSGVIRYQLAARKRLFVSDHFANGGDTFLEDGDFFRPCASGVIRVGDAGGVLPFGLGEMVEQDVQSVL